MRKLIRRNKFHWLAHEKANVARMAIQYPESIHEICRDNEISTSQIFQWMDAYHVGGIESLKRWRAKDSHHTSLLNEYQRLLREMHNHEQ